MAVAQTLECVVVQIHVRQLNFTLRQRIGINGEVMIVRGDLDLSVFNCFTGWFPPWCPNFSLKVFPPRAMPVSCVRDKSRRLAVGPLAADVVYRIGAGLGIAGAVGEEHSVRLQREYVFR